MARESFTWSQLNLFFFPPGFDSLWAKNETKKDPPPCRLVHFLCKLLWRLLHLLKVRRGQEEGLVRLTQSDLPLLVTSEPCLHSRGLGTAGREGRNHSTFPTLSAAGISAALSQGRTKSGTLLSHLAPSVSFLLPFRKTLFSKHSEIKHQRIHTRANSSFPEMLAFGDLWYLQESLQCCFFFHIWKVLEKNEGM